MEASDILWLQTRKECVKVNIRNILYFQATNRHTDLYVHPEKKIGEVCQTLSKIESILPRELFYRCNRTIIVNIDFVERYLNSQLLIILMNGQEISISRRHRKDFDNLMGRF